MLGKNDTLLIIIPGLRVPKPLVSAGLGGETVVGAHLDKPPFFKHSYPIAEPAGREPAISPNRR